MPPEDDVDFSPRLVTTDRSLCHDVPDYMGTGEPSQNARDELASQEFRKFGDGCASAFRAIPPTAVGGSFKPSLQRRAHSNFPEFHPRQWVEGSSAAYNQRDHKLLAIVVYGQRLNLKHPPTAVGGIPKQPRLSLVGRALKIHPLPWVGLREKMTRTRKNKLVAHHSSSSLRLQLAALTELANAPAA